MKSIFFLKNVWSFVQLVLQTPPRIILHGFFWNRNEFLERLFSLGQVYRFRETSPKSSLNCMRYPGHSFGDSFRLPLTAKFSSPIYYYILSRKQGSVNKNSSGMRVIKKFSTKKHLLLLNFFFFYAFCYLHQGDFLLDFILFVNLAPQKIVHFSKK